MGSIRLGRQRHGSGGRRRRVRRIPGDGGRPVDSGSPFSAVDRTPASASSEPVDLDSALAKARSAVEAGEEMRAIRLLSSVYDRYGHGRGRDRLRSALDPLVDALYFSRRRVPEISTWIEVRSGDTLAGICKQLERDRSLVISPGLVMRVNGIADPRRIRVGQKLKILTDPMYMTVSKSTHVMDVYLGDVPVLSYRVGLGKNDSTPVGRFKIVTRQVEPIWFNEGRRIPFGDPRNVLGTRWLGFENSKELSGYGIHGTWEPESIGKNASQGCVRMLNEEIEGLFELVPRGVYVTVVE